MSPFMSELTMISDQASNVGTVISNSGVKSEQYESDEVEIDIEPTKDFLCEEYKQYLQLREYDEYLQERTHQLIQLLGDLSHRNEEKLVNINKERIKIHVFNTYESQKTGNYELDSFNCDEYTVKNMPSWTLKIQGRVMDTQRSDAELHFTSFFKRIMIVTDQETIIWDRQHPESRECDGLEISRLGDVEHTIKILFFIDFTVPIFELSDPLSKIVKVSPASLPQISRSIWRYACDNGLQSKSDHSSIITDHNLKKIFRDVGQFRFENLPTLLRPHLFPPKPIIITHSLKLQGDWIESEKIYDIIINSASIGCESFGNTGEAILNSLTVTPQAKFINMLPYEDRLSHETLLLEVNEVNDRMNHILNKIKHRISCRSFYLSFSSSPANFIKTLLTSRQIHADRKFDDDQHIYEYEISDRRGDFYREPWINRAVSQYLNSSNQSFGDNICKVLMSMQIPDQSDIYKGDEKSSVNPGIRNKSVNAVGGSSSISSKRGRRIQCDSIDKIKGTNKTRKKILRDKRSNNTVGF